MSFGFLDPSWLWALPLSGAPVVMHLAWRQRRRRVEVPSLAFFTAREPRLHARKRLRDLLVLALRCLVIAAAVLALGRPSWRGWGSSGTALAIVIDNSASMALPADLPGSPTRLHCALEDAGALIADLGDSDRAAIITTVEDPLVPELGEATADRARLRAVLDSVRPTAAASGPGEALARAAHVVEAAGGRHREIIVISDFQAHDWGAAPAGTPALGDGTEVLCARVPAARDGCLALSRLELGGRGVLGARPLALRVAVANDTSAAATVLVAAEDDGGRHASATASVPARGEAETALVLPPSPAGEHWARVWIDGATVPALAEGFLAYRCTGPRQVAFYGPAHDFALLPLAIAPDGDGSLSGLASGIHDPVELAHAPPSDAALAVITWQGAQALPPAAGAALMAWVRAGGRLLLLPSATVPAQGAQPPEWAEAHVEAIQGAPGGQPLIALDPRADCFRDLVDAQGAVRFPSVRLRQGLAIDGPAWHGLLGLDDGRAVLSARELGHGQLVVCGLAFSPRWSTLPLSPACLPLAQAFALDALAPTGVARAVAGERVTIGAGAPAGAQVHVVAIAGAGEDWQGSVRADGTLPGFPRAGVYLVRTGGSQAEAKRTLLSVRADRGEAASAVVESAIPALEGTRDQVILARSRQAITRAWESRRGGEDLMPAMVIVALLALFAEGLIANTPLLRVRAAGAPT